MYVRVGCHVGIRFAVCQIRGLVMIYGISAALPTADLSAFDYGWDDCDMDYAAVYSSDERRRKWSWQAVVIYM